MANQPDSELLERLRAEPDRRVDMIVTVRGDPHEYELKLRDFNLQLKRTFALTRKVALAGAASAFVALSNESWVTKIEEDRPVQAVD
jgi:hypothetical protein